MSIEAGVVIDVDGQPIHWHVPKGRTGGSLPDSRDLWEVFWENRERLRGFAHSHPGKGIPVPSHTDITTFAAVEAGLGKRLDWWILSEDGFVLLRHEIDWRYPKVLWGLAWEGEPVWAPKLRELSGYPPLPVRPAPPRARCPDCQGAGRGEIGPCAMCNGVGTMRTPRHPA